MEFKLGADPELWIYDNKLGKIISAHGLFPGTKEEPFKVEHGAIQVDGMAAEYNIHPASSADEFVFFNISVLRSLRDEIKKHNPDLDFSFKFQPVAEFGEEYIASQPTEARMLGCNPDFNAWKDGAVNPTPDAEMPFRTASGHIHLGWGDDIDTADAEHIEACCMMVKQLDAWVAPLFLSLEDEQGKKRRELYGKAGAFRPKKYGVEYRVLSNTWLSNVFYMERLFTCTHTSFKDLLGGYRSYESYYGVHCEQWINEFDKINMRDYFGVVGKPTSYEIYKEEVNVDVLDSLYEKYSKKALVRERALVDFLVEDDEDDFGAYEEAEVDFDGLDNVV